MVTMIYFTTDYYAEQFSDILADIQADDPESATKIIEGFYRAIDSWFDYHDAQAKEYAAVRERVRKTLSM